MDTSLTIDATDNALYQMQKTFVHLPADRIDQARKQLAEVERAIEARVREQVAREIEQLILPATNDAAQIRNGGIEHAAHTARNGAAQ